MTIKAVVFDIGNVLVEWHPEKMFDAVIGEERRRALFANVDLDRMNERVDLGEEIAEVVPEYARAHPEFHDDIMLWHSRWLEMLTPDIPLSAVILRALRAKGMPVFALSNFGVSTLALADQHFPALADFDRRFISGELGLVKPDPAIYAHVEAETGVTPEGLLFIDDRPANVDAAAARGWQTHLFEHPEALAERMLAEGLLSRAEMGL